MAVVDLTWHCYMDLASAAFCIGRTDQAIQMLEKAAEAVAHLAAPNRRLADTLNCMGVLHTHQGRHLRAERCLRQAVRILESDREAEASKLALALFNLASVLEALGRSGEAARHYERAAEIARRASAAGDNHLAVVLQEWADIEMAEGRRTSALFALREALRIHAEATGPQSWEIAVCQDKLAEWYLAQERYSDAESALWQVVRIKEALLGTDEPELARHYRRLGELYVLQNKYTQADRVLAHAARLSLRASEARPREIGQSLQVLADSQQAQVRPLLAEKLRRLAQEVSRRRLKAAARQEILDAIEWLTAYLDRG